MLDRQRRLSSGCSTIMRLKALLLVMALVSLAAGKPQVSLEESCRAARAIVVVETTAQAGVYHVHQVLYAGEAEGLKADADVAVDLKGMVYDKGAKYILFMEP